MLYNILESFMIYHYMHVYTHIHHHTVCIYIYTYAQIHISKYANATPNISKFHDNQCVNERRFLGHFSGPCQSRLALDQSNTWPSGTFFKAKPSRSGLSCFSFTKGSFLCFFSEEVADQCNIIPLLLCRANYAPKNTHGIWVFDELQTSQLYVSCSAGSSDVQPFCSFLPRKTTEKLHKKSLGDFKMSAKWIRTAREISITPQIRLCFVPFFSFWLISFLGIPSIFSIFLCVCGFMPHLMLFFRIPFFHPPVFPWRIQQHHLGYPTAPGLFRLTPCCLEVVQSLRVTNTPSERQMWQIWLLGRWQPRNERAWWCEIPQETWWIKTLRQPNKKKTWYPVAFFP